MTKAIATRYKQAARAEKGRILDERCATTGWHRSHARRPLTQALRPRIVRPRAARPPVYGTEVIDALRFCWAVLGAPTGQRLADDRARMALRGRGRYRSLVTGA